LFPLSHDNGSKEKISLFPKSFLFSLSLSPFSFTSHSPFPAMEIQQVRMLSLYYRLNDDPPSSPKP